MTLDEAIKNQEEIIESCREKINDVKFINKTRLGRDIVDIQSKYIQECEQYIEWLRELKERKSKCKWIKYDGTICPQNHDIDNPYWRIPENTECLKYCPYCGKEIEVVKE